MFFISHMMIHIVGDMRKTSISSEFSLVGGGQGASLVRPPPLCAKLAIKNSNTLFIYVFQV